MALPNPYQYLKHGALLCKKNFATFAETFNFLVDFSRNLRGDGDANNTGPIQVDRTIPDRPVIRFNENLLPGERSGHSDTGCWIIISKEKNESAGTYTIGLDNCYFQAGGRTFTFSGSQTSTNTTPSSNHILAVLFDSSYSTTVPRIQILCWYNDLSALAQDQTHQNYVIYPLYQFSDDGEVVCDFRNILNLGTAEFM